MTSSETLQAFFQSKEIQTILPSEPEYPALNTYYQLQDPKVQIALVRPRNEDEVAIAVQYATTNKIKIVVRSGGGDLFGRSQAEGALSIDMRQINFVTVNADRATATVGGGCVVNDVATQLSQHGLAAAVPPIPTVGYTGWATLGGYGPFAPHFGLGVDQIVGAKVVNGNGKVIDANPEMLKGIRGGGGNLGVVVQLTIRVYPLKKIQTGLILFEAADISSAFQNFIRAYNNLWAKGVPSELGLQPVASNMGDHGRQFGVIVVWSSPDRDAGQTWISKIAALGKEIMGTVGEVAVPQWMENNKALVPLGIYGHNTSVSVSRMTDEIAQVIGRNLAKIPSDPSTMFSYHELRGRSTDPREYEDSVFGVREPHYVIELLGNVLDAANIDTSNAWITAFREELRQCDGVLPGDYISLTRPSDTTLERLYGSQLSALYALKQRYDPQGVFDLAVPRLH